MCREFQGLIGIHTQNFRCREPSTATANAAAMRTCVRLFRTCS
jgi:hypothetical protein